MLLQKKTTFSTSNAFFGVRQIDVCMLEGQEETNKSESDPKHVPIGMGYW